MDLPQKPTLQTEPIFSTKALLAGTLGSLCIAVGAPYGNMVIRGSYMSRATTALTTAARCSPIGQRS